MPKICNKKFAPSHMDKRVSIQSVTQVSDGQGGFTETWATSSTVWAKIEPVKAYEKIQAQQLETPITHKIKMRYLSGVTTAKRILYGSRIFHIKGVINESEKNVFLTITAQEIEA